MKDLVTHFRSKGLSYLAFLILGAVLAGSAYAAVSRGQRITYVHSTKSGITCGGGCPAKTVLWAYITTTIPSSRFAGPGVYQEAAGGIPAQLTHLGVGSWIVRFGTNMDLSNCARVANLTGIRGSATVGGYGGTNADPTAIPILTTDASGNPADADFVVAVFCGGNPQKLVTHG
jgi:hypothetical protein